MPTASAVPLSRSSGDADPSAGVGPLRCAETWIAGLLQGHFFHSCHAHLLRRKCEVCAGPLSHRQPGAAPWHSFLTLPPTLAPSQTTFFCTDCCSLPLCIHCLDDHRHHHVIQVRERVGGRPAPLFYLP